MRRFLLPVLLAVLVLCLVPLRAEAATEATMVGYYATVASDESAQVTVTVNLRLESSYSELTFPVPRQAYNITLNGSRVETSKSSQAKQIDLSKTLGGKAGEFSFTVTYSLEDVVGVNEAGTPQLQLPILSGFSHPIAKLEFSVTLPGQLEGKPAFSSGYHQENIELDLTSTVSGSMVQGQSLKALKDHETLTMTLDVSADLFPNAPIVLDKATFDDVALLVCAALALLYWLIFLRCKPLHSKLSPTAPDGFSAGELGSILTMQGCQLTMTVFTWAQLGYILIQPVPGGRVLLHKRMDMGNERSSFEQKLFSALFGSKLTVDATSQRYMNLSLKAEKLSSGARSLLQRGSGNTRIFRVLGAGMASFAGVSIGIGLSSGGALQVFWAIMLGIGAGLSGWAIHGWADELFVFGKLRILRAAALSVLWLLLGFLGKEMGAGVILVLSQLLIGLMAAFGGKRTEEGMACAGQVLGLRRYMRTLPREEMKRIVSHSPEYYYDMAPLALALGMDRAFAKRFGTESIAPCPYLTLGSDSRMSTRQWSSLMRRTAKAMDLRKRRRSLDKFVNTAKALKNK